MSTKRAFSICLIGPEGYPHLEAFRELALSLQGGLESLGHCCSVHSGLVDDGSQIVILGAHLLAAAGVTPPRDAILYNTEQVDASSPWLTPDLLEHLLRSVVWDYSRANINKLAKMGVQGVEHVPVGYSKGLTCIESAPEQDIDVLFYGSMNERRSAIIEGLRSEGLRVETLFGVYGSARDAYIARAKVVLNVHHYAAKIFEAVRVSYLLANSKAVVSERGASPADEAAYEAGVAFCRYEKLVESCIEIVADDNRRHQLEAAGFKTFKSRKQSMALLGALDRLPGQIETARNSSVTPAPQPENGATHAPQSSQPLTPAPTEARLQALQKEAKPTAPNPTPAAANDASGAAPQGYYEFPRPEVVAVVNPAGKRVLDVGCAAGAMGALMLEHGASEVVGLELNPDAAHRARARLTAVYGQDVGTDPSLPYPPGYFDVITFADVLEHMAEPETVLRILRRYLAPDGAIVCSIPNVRHESVLLPLLVNGTFTYEDAGILDRTHLRFFTLSSMVDMLRNAGFAAQGQAVAVRSQPSQALSHVAPVVKALGGNPQSFLDEATVIQYVLKCRPIAATQDVRPEAVPNLWRGSAPSRVLLAPDFDNPDDRWTQTLTSLVKRLKEEPGPVSVGLAVAKDRLRDLPAALHEIAQAHPDADLALVEAPTDDNGWRRLVAGAAAFVPTGPQALQEELCQWASHAGVPVVGQPAAQAAA